MEEKEILDKFGRIVISNVYDESLKHFKNLRAGTTKWSIGKEYTTVLNKLSDEDKDIIFKLYENTLNTALFSIMQIFEENPEFKIVYEDDGNQVDLNKISEMLKSEHYEWIEKFSTEINNEGPI